MTQDSSRPERKNNPNRSFGDIIVPDTKTTSIKLVQVSKLELKARLLHFLTSMGKVDVKAHMEEEYDKAATYVDPIIHNQIIVENQSLPYNWMLDIEPIITINMVDTQSK